MEEIKTTRTELLHLKTQIKLASQGKSLLEKKEDALFLEFLKLKDKALAANKELLDAAAKANYALAMAKAIAGTVAVKSVTFGQSGKLEVQMTYERLLGLKVPKIITRKWQRLLLNRNYSFLNVSSYIDEAAEAFENYLEAIVKVAAVEAKLKKIIGEVKKTRRRVRTLEQTVLPQLTNNYRFIAQSLDERAREDIFRLKLIKN